MSESKVIERVRKLLALADENGGGTEAERMQAAERAQVLMARHNIAKAQVEADGGDAGTILREEVETVSVGGRWRSYLLGAIADPVGVKVLERREGRTYAISLVGREDSVAYARMLYDWLVPGLMADCAAAWRAYEGPDGKRTFDRSFYVGAANRIFERLRAANESADVGTALVPAKSAVDRWVHENVGRTHKASLSSGRSRAGRDAGANAGDRADLRPGNKVGAGGGKLLGA